MTGQTLIVSVVMPGIVVLLGFAALKANEWYNKRHSH
jgi:hypothetical protein